MMRGYKEAQAAYDRMGPCEHEDWLETDQGADWLADSVDGLQSGVDLVVGGKVVLWASELADASYDEIEALVLPFADAKLDELRESEHD